jgi:hypothetical protein
LAYRRSNTNYHSAVSVLALKGRLGIVEDMAKTSNRCTDAIAVEASEKRGRGAVETNSSAARVRELLGPAIAARL